MKVDFRTPRHRLGFRKYKLLEDETFSINGKKFKVPAGYEWNGASSPLFRAALLYASAPHDYAYDGLTTLTRAEADLLFYKEARKDNVPTWLAVIAYLCVRCAFWHWNGSKN